MTAGQTAGDKTPIPVSAAAMESIGEPMSQYPALEKQSESIENGHSHALGEFIDWLHSEGIHFMRHGPHLMEVRCDDAMTDDDNVWCTKNGGCTRCHGTEYVTREREGYYPENRRTEQLLADYFEVDLVKCEDERQAMLDEIRAAHDVTG